jgi:hypothetical protein
MMVNGFYRSPATARHMEPHEHPDGLQQHPATRERRVREGGLFHFRKSSIERAGASTQCPLFKAGSLKSQPSAEFGKNGTQQISE